MISIVSAYFNRKPLLINTLESLMKSEIKDFEFILVDDCSDEEHRVEDLCEYYSFLKVIRIENYQKWYKNPCVPFNIGFKQAKGDIIIIQNPECYHYDDILKHVTSNLKKDNYFSYSCYSLSREKNNIVNFFTENDIINRSVSEDIVGDEGWYNHSLFRPVGYHFCSAIYKNQLDEIGGFDERYAYGISWDDNEILERIKRKGLNVTIVDNKKVLHQWHETFNYKMSNHIELGKINRDLFHNVTLKETTWNKKGDDLKNKKILIIGGTGALGKNLIKKYQNDNQILILSRDEHKQVFLSKEDWINKKNIEFYIGDVKDIASIRNCIEYYKPNVVINTAALKHVPICEANPFESVNVNIIGHQNLIQAIKWSNHKIETLIFVSTDKACKPINVYGMCKAISERIYIEYAKQQSDIKVCLVRYGNVLESTGSVIPLFKKILEDGKDKLPITDMRMTRFLLTLERAVDLIDWVYKNDTHGKIAVPKIESFSISSIAKALFLWKNINGELEITGIRPGEKLHEEMISDIEWMRTIDAGDNFLITENIVRTESKSYNSLDSIMDDNNVYDFLKNNNII